MKLLKALGSEELTNTEKLETINKFVTEVRAAYGNADEVIDPIKVRTVDGLVPLSLLNDEEKVAIATGIVKTAVANATIVTEETQGAKFDRVLEGLVAVDAILSNLDAESDSKY